jgi:transposase-like protein
MKPAFIVLWEVEMDKPRRRRRSRAQRQRLLGRAEQSELSVTDFCRAEDIRPASFYQWRKRLAPATSASSEPNPAGDATAFVDLGTLASTAEAAKPSGWNIELQLGGEVVLRFHRR